MVDGAGNERARRPPSTTLTDPIGARVLVGDPLPFATMADKSQKVPENVPGRFYVDATCIDCDQCRTMAPKFFGRNADSGARIGFG